MSTQLVHPEDVEYMWAEVEPILDRVKEHTEGELETSDFLHLLNNGEMQLWVSVEGNEVEAAMVTQIITYPQKKILRIISLAGHDFKRLRPSQELVESFAVQQNCTALEMWGRKGWKKLLTDWQDTYIVYTKDLKHRMQ